MTLIVASERGDQPIVLILDPARPRELAVERVGPGVRPEECRTYDVDPCPKLDESRARG